MYLGNIFKCFFMIIDLVWTNKFSNAMQFMYVPTNTYYILLMYLAFFLCCLGFLKPRYVPKIDLFSEQSF